MTAMPLLQINAEDFAPSCDDCDGTGEVEIAASQTRGRSCSNDRAAFLAGEIVGEVECETCKGRGFIIDEEDARPSLNLERMMQ